MIIHATTITRYVHGDWRGVLIMGPSGAGKSDLALRALSQGFRLVSDDYTEVWLSGHHLYAITPETIAGKIEVRGIGILTHPYRPFTRLSLCVHCQNTPPERLPEPAWTPIAGRDLRALRLNPFEASAVSRLCVALEDGS